MTTSKKRGSKIGAADNIGPRRAAIALAGRSGWSNMAPDDVALARQVKRTVWDLAGRSSVTGARLDTLALATVRNRYRRAVDLFGREPILALLRQPGPGRCSWCACRVLCATAAPPVALPTPTPALQALLGSQCGKCRSAWEALEVADRERSLIASGIGRHSRPTPAATGELWADHQPRPVTAAAGPQMPVAEAIRLARRRQREREAAYR